MSSDNETNGTIRAELEAVAAAWERAILANDAEAIGGFMADEWVIVSETGATKKAEFLASVASGDVTHETFHGDIVSVRQYGDTAIVLARVRNSGAYIRRPFKADEWTSDVFVKRDGRWRCVHSHITAAKPPV